MTATLLAFIDGQHLTDFGPRVSKAKNAYFSTSGGKYGLRVEAAALPNGVNSVFSVGIDAAHSVTIPVVKDSDGTAYRGEIRVKVSGVEMIASAYINEVKSGYTLKLSVRNVPKPGGAKPKTAKEIFANS